jgi:hypothetical protein
MYEKPKFGMTRVRVNNSVIGETLEQKIERIVNNNEPIKDGAPLLYTDRSEGVRASTNIRTDRFEIALEATEKIAKSYQAKREDRAEQKRREKEVSKAENIATNNNAPETPIE